MAIIGMLPAHPAQLWMMRALEAELANRGVSVRWLLRSKDILVQLAEELGMPYEFLSHARSGFVGNALELFTNIFRVGKFSRHHQVDLWFSKYGAANIASSLLATPSFSFNDDDIDVVPLIGWTSYPFAEKVIVPRHTRMGRFENKTLRYDSWHELFYLHPNRFTPDADLARQALGSDDRDYVIIRLSSLQAHHDAGETGIAIATLEWITGLLEPEFRVLISAEGELPAGLSSREFRGNPALMHHLLAHASLLISDSQTMSAEAAVLGTPALRLSSFKGRLSYLEEMESMGLLTTFLPADESAYLAWIENFRSDPVTARQRAAASRERMLARKSDPVPEVAKLLARRALSRTSRHSH